MRNYFYKIFDDKEKALSFIKRKGNATLYDLSKDTAKESMAFANGIKGKKYSVEWFDTM